jgi:hypothetical protein
MSAGLRILMALALVARAAGAQDQRLAQRLDKPTYLAVNAIVDSARLVKLPTAPLVDKALEGAAKGSDGPKIVAAVHQLSLRMAASRRALGASSTGDEIKTAASALGAGMTEHDLQRLRVAAGKRPVTMPLAVAIDLIGRDVPVATASSLVIQLARSGVKDADLALFQRNVRADIDHGADPTVAATTRARGLVVRSTGTAPKPAE